MNLESKVKLIVRILHFDGMEIFIGEIYNCNGITKRENRNSLCIYVKANPREFQDLWLNQNI